MKAVFWGLVSASAITAQGQGTYTWLNDLYNVLNGKPSKDMSVQTTTLRAFAYFHYLCIPSLVYLSTS